jgi:uncharacterized protein (TIRG00374 family)
MKKRYSILIIIIVILLLLYTLKDVSPKEILTLLKNINPFFIFLAFLSYIVMLLVWTLRLKNTISDYTKANFFFLFQTVLAGSFLNIITPGSNVGGEPVRAYFLGQKYKKPKTKFLALILADKTFNLMALSLFIALSILFIFPLLEISLEFKIILQILVIILYAIVVIGLIAKRKNKILWISEKLFKSRTIKKKFKHPKILATFLRRKINSFMKLYKGTITRGKKLYIGIGLSIIYWILYFLASYFIFLALGQNINFLYVIISVAIGSSIGDVSPIPGGVGLNESIMILLYTALSVPLALGTTVALLSRFLYYLITLLFGGLTLIRLRMKYK